MNKILQDAMDYVDRTLIESGNNNGRHHSFRHRNEHTKRVLHWAVKLSEDMPDVDTDILYMAAIFHDLGYVRKELEDHEKLSEILFRQYAKENHFDEEYTEKVALCIGTHSDKDKMEQPDSIMIEQLLLMEADLLDEEGALAICWDSLACACEGNPSYEASMERTKKEVSWKLKRNPMVTPKARAIWKHKQEFVEQYLKELTEDLKKEL